MRTQNLLDWRELAAEALGLAADPSRSAVKLGATAKIAQSDWMVAVEGKSAGWAHLSFLYACRAYAEAGSMASREAMSLMLRGTAEVIAQLLYSSGRPPRPTPAVRHRADIDD